MTNMLDDGVGLMVGSLLAQAGASFTYRRGAVQHTLTMRKAPQVSQLLDQVTGASIQFQPVDFIIDTASFTATGFVEPQPGDEVSDGTSIWHASLSGSEKPFRITSPQMMRIHTIQKQ